MIVPGGLDDGAPEEILSAQHELHERIAHARILGVRGERARQRGADELPFFRIEGLEQARHDRRLGTVLEVRVRDGAQAVVAIVEHPRHHVARARIVEARQDDERAKADVLIRVLLNGAHQRGHRLRRGRATDRP